MYVLLHGVVLFHYLVLSLSYPRSLLSKLGPIVVSLDEVTIVDPSVSLSYIRSNFVFLSPKTLSPEVLFFFLGLNDLFVQKSNFLLFFDICVYIYFSPSYFFLS